MNVEQLMNRTVETCSPDEIAQTLSAICQHASPAATTGAAAAARAV